MTDQISSASDQYLALIDNKAQVEASTVSDVYDRLPPIKPSELLGSWGGGFFETGHPVGNQLREIKWVGKEFESLDEVDPVIVERAGQRSSWGQWGKASVRLAPSRRRV